MQHSCQLVKRYQESSWLVRRWRDRWLLQVPYRAVKVWVKNNDITWRQAWSIARGLCDLKRNWIYTYDEAKAMSKEYAK